LRFGIGKDFFPGQQVDYVLGRWTEEEWAALEGPIAKAADACLSFVSVGLNRAMNNL